VILKARKDIKDEHAAWRGYPRIYIAPSNDPGYQKYGRPATKSQPLPTFQEIVAEEKNKIGATLGSEE
jgi:hypothetical protein